MTGRPGPAAAILTSVALRTAVIIRCMAVGYVALQIVIWHSYYGSDPWRVAAPAAAIVWGAALAVWLGRHPPGSRLSAADSAVHVALALSAATSVPLVMRGDVANWLFILLAGQCVIPVWYAPLALGGPLVLASSAAYWASAVAGGGARDGHTAPAASAIVLVAVAVVAWFGLRALRHRAAVSDAALAAADADEREQFVTLSRDTERREHERLLHDTVLNTLTALARGDAGERGTREVVARCRRDVALIEYVLRGSGDTGARPTRDRGTGRLLAAFEAIAAEMRARGLDVRVEAAAGGNAAACTPAGNGTGTPGVNGRSAAHAGKGTPAGNAMATPSGSTETASRNGASSPPGMNGTARTGPQEVPVPVVVAIARAVREALENVARHAGTGRAWVDVRGPGGWPGNGSGQFVVRVRDRGAGFEPGRVRADRLGVRRSIIERVEDCGGSAAIRSAPGAGTTVTLSWPRADQPAAQGVHQ